MLIVPHAGYVYSGPVAATAYRTVTGAAVKRVALVGPAHHVAVPAVALPAAGAFATPLGVVPVAPPPALGVTVDAAAHASEHSLEVQLPFLQMLLGEFDIIPLLCNRAHYLDVAPVLEAVTDAATLVVVSTDLSHYLDYETATVRDAAAAAAIVGLRPDAISDIDACGATALRAGLHLAAGRGWQCRLLDLRNSGDTSGARHRVVGYGAFAVGPD